MRKLLLISSFLMTTIAPSISFAQPIDLNIGMRPNTSTQQPPPTQQKTVEPHKKVKHKTHKYQTKSQRVTENLNTQELNKVTNINNSSATKK